VVARHRGGSSRHLGIEPLIVVVQHRLGRALDADEHLPAAERAISSTIRGFRTSVSARVKHHHQTVEVAADELLPHLESPQRAAASSHVLPSQADGGLRNFRDGLGRVLRELEDSDPMMAFARAMRASSSPASGGSSFGSPWLRE
jgi:hypothetical protein